MRVSYLILLILLVNGCAEDNTGKKQSVVQEEVKKDNSEILSVKIIPVSEGFSIDKDFWENVSPIELLDSLTLSPFAGNAVFICNAPDGWLREEHIEILKAKLKEDDKLAAVLYSYYESHAHFYDLSTLHKHIQYMLDGYALGEYPPTLSSPVVNNYSVHEILKTVNVVVEREVDGKKTARQYPIYNLESNGGCIVDDNW
jgi:hypothetical protein